MSTEKSNADRLNNGRIASRVLSASTLKENEVYNPTGERLGSIKEFMLDINTGQVCYVVMSFGGFLSLGEKLFAIPWGALTIDTENKRFLMDTDEDQLKKAPGFDPNNWPNMADSIWEKDVRAYFQPPH